MIRTEIIASISELLHRHAGARGDKVAFADVRGAITCGDLMRTTANLAGALTDAGVARQCGCHPVAAQVVHLGQRI